MKHAVVAPSVGESITEVSILKWAKQDGQAVKVGEMLLEIESDKATVELVAEQAGVLKILSPAGERVTIGAKIGEIDDAGTATVAQAAPASAPTVTAPPAASAPGTAPESAPTSDLAPSVRRMTTENQLNPADITGTGKDGRLTKGDVVQHLERGPTAQPATTQTAPAQTAPAAPSRSAPPAAKPGERRVRMSLLRAKIAERLVHAQHTAAILTTFNEVDMTEVNRIRATHKDAFKAKHGVPLSFMSFFTKASIAALKAIPEVNAYIEGDEVVYHDYNDIGIAVGTERGLVVPVIRGAEKKTFAQIESDLAALALKARNGKLSIADMSGGTFTISNGGTYGSLLSTPILNPPQSGILGMHKIMDRPVVVNGKIEARPMMYLALSYDHRIIDGKGAVTFLVTLKEFLESPEKLGLDFI